LSFTFWRPSRELGFFQSTQFILNIKERKGDGFIFHFLTAEQIYSYVSPFIATGKIACGRS